MLTVLSVSVRDCFASNQTLEGPGDGFEEIGEWDNSMAKGMLPLDRECEAFGEKMPERVTTSNGHVEDDKTED